MLCAVSAGGLHLPIKMQISVPVSKGIAVAICRREAVVDAHGRAEAVSVARRCECGTFAGMRASRRICF